MTNKTIHVTNESGIVSDTYVDLLYTVMGRDVVKPFKINPIAKEALERSIERGKTVTVGSANHAFYVQNEPDGTMCPSE